MTTESLPSVRFAFSFPGFHNGTDRDPSVVHVPLLEILQKGTSHFGTCMLGGNLEMMAPSWFRGHQGEEWC